MGGSARRRAPAKVNLALAVGPPNPAPPMGDGLHPIASWMVAVDLFDEMTVTRLEHDRASRYAILWSEEAPRPSPVDWPITKDLAVRAHLLLEETVGRRLPVQMKLEKRIPVGAGLAGGSSDAAAALLAINECFGLGLRDARLRALAAQLGSDVPFFLHDEEACAPAFVSGVGHVIERTAPARSAGKPAQFALILPDLACATPEVYRALDARPGVFDADRARRAACAGEVHDAALFNDLAEPACRVEPALGALRSAISDALGRGAHVTGSGAGLFVVLDERDAETTIELLRACEALRECVVVRARAL